MAALLFCLLACIAAMVDANGYEYDSAGMPLMAARWAGEPTIFSFRGRGYASPRGLAGAESCPIHCDCPFQWPGAVYCDHGALNTTPTALPPLTRFLYLQGNRLKGLRRADFANVTQLLWLVLDRNQITNELLEAGVLASLTGLQKLLMNRNNLTSIPGPLPAGLNQLRLAYNQISEVPTDSLRGLVNLTLLLLQGNLLKTLGEGAMNDLKSLSLLDLSQNRFREYPRRIPLSVKQLYLSNNSLSDLPPDPFGPFHDLRYLRLSHNNLSDKAVPAMAFNLSSLVELDLAYNGLQGVPWVPQTLQYLYLEGNQIQAFNVSSFCRVMSPVHFSRLRLLRLDGNRLRAADLPSNWMHCLRLLGHVYI
ncbi:lumican-like isoform X2 [Ambystoma mexicanum]